MSKLDELIQELCPDGVEYKKLGDLIKIEKGKQLNKTHLFDKYEENLHPVINGGISPSGFWNEYNYSENLITISQGGASAGYVNYIKTKFWAGAHCYVVSSVDNDIIYRYVYHFLKSKEIELKKSQVGAGIPSVSLHDINYLSLPIPPLEVQCEIVRILDKFTLLTAELTAELTARRKQYEYYRNLLVSFNNFIQKRKFGNIASIQRGASPRPISQFITNDMDGVNWIKIGDVDKESKYITKSKEKITIDGSKKSRKVKKGDFILSNSMSFGRPYILAIDGCIHDGWLSISDFEDVFISDFLYYLLNSNDIQNEFRKKASFGGAVQNLNADIVRGIELHIPSKDEQQKIINILDRFDKLCNDITSGIPAEIELNNKRYEYYRDKLLIFKEKK